MENFKKLCESIFALDPSIRYVRVLGEKGNILDGGYRNDEITQYFTKNELIELEKFYFFVWGIQEFHKPRVGGLSCAILEFDKIKKFSFALGDGNLLIVSTNPEVSIDIKDKIQENITTILKTSSSNFTA